MQDLISRFSNQDRTNIDKKNVSEIISFRQEFLHQHFDPHNQGTFQLGFVWATMANTLPTAFWSLYFVTRDQTALKECREEADRVMRPWLIERQKYIDQGQVPPKDTTAVANILSQMPKLESVVSEALRLCIASITLRQAMENFELKLGNQSVKIRQGDQVVLAPTLTHYDSDIYEAPFVFQWDRFFIKPVKKETEKEVLDGGDGGGDGGDKEPSLSGTRSLPIRYKNGKKIPPAIALQPFGGGTTMCPGRHFALAEIKAFVAIVLCQWEIQYDEDAAKHHSHLSMGKDGVPNLEQARAGLGSLPPSKKDPVKCKWRHRSL
jgi:cholesterol 7alpha-monooxygenase